MKSVPSIFLIFSITITTGENTYPEVKKSCATKELCHVVYNMSAGLEVYYVEKCCQGDLCNKETIKLPSINRKENGVQCPICYAQGKSCTPSGTIKCPGEQTKCFTFSGGVYNGTQFEDWVFRGCTTENVCKYRSPTYPDTSLQEGYRVSCSDPKH